MITVLVRYKNEKDKIITFHSDSYVAVFANLTPKNDSHILDSYEGHKDYYLLYTDYINPYCLGNNVSKVIINGIPIFANGEVVFDYMDRVCIISSNAIYELNDYENNEFDIDILGVAGRDCDKSLYAYIKPFETNKDKDVDLNEDT